MITIIISVLFNLLCYGIAFTFMSKLSAISFLCISIIAPVFLNVLVFVKGKYICENKLITISVLTGITTLFYILWGIATSLNGTMHEFATRNSFSDGNITVAISENSNSVANIAYMVLIQVSVLVFIKYIQERGMKYDTSK